MTSFTEQESHKCYRNADRTSSQQTIYSSDCC